MAFSYCHPPCYCCSIACGGFPSSVFTRSRNCCCLCTIACGKEDNDPLDDESCCASDNPNECSDPLDEELRRDNNDSDERAGQSTSVNDFSIRYSLVVEGRCCSSPNGCSSCISYHVFAALDVTRIHERKDVIITARPIMAPMGNVNSMKSINPSVATPARRSVCDLSIRYFRLVVAAMGWETMTERGPPESSVRGRRRFTLPLRGVLRSSMETITVPDNVVDDLDG